jgi:16S rRNA C967 or C1407 C5-methylase (RsmB/RsmF family)/NOL1/NOP2/fmu family ribosome biogenesis protein
LDSVEGTPGFDRSAFVAAHENPQQVTSIRLNPYKWKVQEASAFLSVAWQVPWSTQGHYLGFRPDFTLDPLLHGGAYYVQEPSSMFLEQALRQTLDLSLRLRILDLCAAPGGKSTLIQSLINRQSTLLSNEVIKSRVGALQQNLARWGVCNQIVSNNDPSDFTELEGVFDAIVVDAPCSGSGMFRKEPESIQYWKEDLVTLCQQRQKRILDQAWPALKKEGVLIYSTCSYSPAENEEILDWLLRTKEAESLRLDLDPAWNVVESGSPEKQGWGYRFYPHRLMGEGLYLACISKKSEANIPFSKFREKVEQPGKKEREIVIPFLQPDASHHFAKFDDRIHLMSPGMDMEYLQLKPFLYIKSLGTTLGRFAGAEWIPHHELALSVHLSQQVAGLAVSREEAIQYLRKEELRESAGLQGWGLVRYEELALGWIKALKNRINNYFPKDWRILKRD